MRGLRQRAEPLFFNSKKVIDMNSYKVDFAMDYPTLMLDMLTSHTAFYVEGIDVDVVLEQWSIEHFKMGKYIMYLNFTMNGQKRQKSAVSTGSCRLHQAMLEALEGNEIQLTYAIKCVLDRNEFRIWYDISQNFYHTDLMKGFKHVEL